MSQEPILADEEQAKKALEEEDCEPCKMGVILGIAKYVCEQNTGEKLTKESCDSLYEKATLGEITPQDLIKKIRETVTDPQDILTLNSVEEVLNS